MATLIQQSLSSTWSGVRLVNLNQQVRDLLGEIEKISIVQTASVHDNHGSVLGALAGADFDKEAHSRIGVAIAQCLAVFQARAGCRDLEFHFEKKIVYVRDLGNAFLVTFCAPNTSLSMLRMTVNVTTGVFESDPDLQKNLKLVADSKKDLLAASYLDALGSQLVAKAQLK